MVSDLAIGAVRIENMLYRVRMAGFAIGVVIAALFKKMFG
jgi:hypothetical protein